MPVHRNCENINLPLDLAEYLCPTCTSEKAARKPAARAWNLIEAAIAAGDQGSQQLLEEATRLNQLSISHLRPSLYSLIPRNMTTAFLPAFADRAGRVPLREKSRQSARRRLGQVLMMSMKNDLPPGSIGRIGEALSLYLHARPSVPLEDFAYPASIREDNGPITSRNHDMYTLSYDEAGEPEKFPVQIKLHGGSSGYDIPVISLGKVLKPLTDTGYPLTRLVRLAANEAAGNYDSRQETVLDIAGLCLLQAEQQW